MAMRVEFAPADKQRNGIDFEKLKKAPSGAEILRTEWPLKKDSPDVKALVELLRTSNEVEIEPSYNNVSLDVTMIVSIDRKEYSISQGLPESFKSRNLIFKRK